MEAGSLITPSQPSVQADHLNIIPSPAPPSSPILVRWAVGSGDLAQGVLTLATFLVIMEVNEVIMFRPYTPGLERHKSRPYTSSLAHQRLGFEDMRPRWMMN